MHCASAGEFEQGKPVAEALKAQHPSYKLLVSFFSPSGYAAAQNYAAADHICYLPLDTRKNAQRFIKTVKPQLAVFVKYEFWYHHLSAAAFHHVPLLLVSGVFRKDQIFFAAYGGFFRRMLFLFRYIFVQDKASLALLQRHGLTACGLGGDTRFDRVAELNRQSETVPLIDDFIQNKKAVVAGSTWEGDENRLQQFVQSNPDVKLILAPHEVNERHLQNLQRLFPNAVRYSLLQKVKQRPDAQVLIIDCVGLLSRLYQHAAVAYVGGGFTNDGIHNILEAAVWGKPVLFGPNYKKYREAFELIAAGGGFSVADGTALNNLAGTLIKNQAYRQEVGAKAKAYVAAHTGATQNVLDYVQEKRLLTNA